MFMQRQRDQISGMTPQQLRARQMLLGMMQPNYGQASNIGEGFSQLAAGINAGIQGDAIKARENDPSFAGQSGATPETGDWSALFESMQPNYRQAANIGQGFSQLASGIKSGFAKSKAGSTQRSPFGSGMFNLLNR
ncbi:hypothetical protein [Thioclava sp. IC9]|uniref:hypothetical protein n=1 Tax=Thioclava sp. IC9 TaxID=1973007 RepID=UPI000B53CA23|nr:hypothetical protein [Thioclava sp. IC9]OWY02303.1 hypothetical protein B6V76_12840 [Thioclava sp. IC9]